MSAPELAARVRTALPSTAIAQTGEEAAAETARNVGSFIGIIRTALTGFALVALFIGSFIIVNTFSILVTQRTRELGLLRAIGANRRQVLGSIIGESLGVGLVGSVLGALGGVVLALLLQLGLRAAFGGGGDVGVTVKPVSLVGPAVLGTVITVLAALYPGIRGSRVSPLAAMRDADATADEALRDRALAGAVVTLAGSALFGLGLTAPSAPAVGVGAVILFVGVALLLAVVARPLSGVLGAPLRRLGVASDIGVGNAQRNPRRTASTASALMIGLALIGGVATFASSLVASVTGIIEDSIQADLVVQPKGFGNGYPSTITAELLALPDAERGTSIRFGDVQLADGAVKQAVAVDAVATDLIGLRRLDPGPGPLALDEVLVSEQLAKDRNLAVGATLPVTYAKSGPATVRVAGIFAKNQLAGNLLLSLATYEAHFTQSQDGVALLRARSGRLPQLRDEVRSVTDANPVVSVKTRDEFLQQQKDQVAIFLRLVYALLALSIIIAVFGIVNTLALSVFERTREIGLLRAVGMVSGQVKRMIRVEAVVVAVLGGVVGLALGVVVAITFMQRCGRRLRPRDPAVPAGVRRLFAALAGVIAAIYPALKACR